MPRDGNVTREKILDTAMGLAISQGHVATPIDEVIAAVRAVTVLLSDLLGPGRGDREDRMPNTDIRFGPRSPNTLIMIL